MQHKNIQEAISNAVYVHGKSADLLIERGEHTYFDVLATDFVENIPKTLKWLHG